MWWGSFGYLKRHRLLHFHLSAPAVLVVLALAGWWLSGWLTTVVSDSIHAVVEEALPAPSAPGQQAWWHGALLWGSSRLDWLVEWGVLLFVLWVKVKATKYLLITLMAPFMSALAAAVATVETGREFPFSWSALLRDIARGIRLSAVLLLMELALGLGLWVSGAALTLLAPPLAVVMAPVGLLLSWLTGAYFFGAAVHDAVYEQAGLDWRASLRAGWSQRGHLIGIGAIFSLWMAYPIVGPYFAAFLGPVPCTVAASRLYFSSHQAPSH